MPYMVRAQRDIRPGTIITTDFVELVYLQIAPEDACFSLDDALNKEAVELVPKGFIVKTTSLKEVAS
jgi:hypothetical protein